MHPQLTAAVPLAHAGGPVAPHDLLPGWSPEPAVLGGLAVLAAAYAVGARALWRAGSRALSAGQAAAFAAGLAAVAVALLSPLDALASALFAAHMAQHMLLVMVAAPLLVLGAPGLPLLLALPAGGRRRLGRLRRHPAVAAARRLCTRPMVAWGLHVGTLWAWHLPGPYQAALGSVPVHAVEHAGFLATGMLFWWVVLSRRGRRRLAPGFAVLYLFAAALQASALGALLTLAPAPLYPRQAAASAAWGAAPLADQQLAGLVMWVPADLVYLGAAGTLFMFWLLSLERTSPRQGEPRRPAAPVAPRRSRALWLVVAVLAGGGLLQLGLAGRPAAAAQAGGRGRLLYQQSCSSCHGQRGEGTGRGPSLVGVGAASADFYLSTGRMPLTDPGQTPERAKPAFGRDDIDALVAYVASLGGGPAIPAVDPAAGRLAEGERLYQENCAACHSATGTGGALTSGQVAPGLARATPVQVAEAIRVGPGPMPKFRPEALDDRQVDSIAGYVGRLRRGGDRGGWGLGRIGPITEGLVAWVLGLGLLIVVVRRIGKEVP